MTVIMGETLCVAAKQLNQRKDLDKQRQTKNSEKLRQQGKDIETFLLQDQDRRPESGCSQGKAEGWDVCSQGRWHISLPSCQQEDKLTLTATHTPELLLRNVSPSKRDRRQMADASNSESDTGGE